jgi:hypothetical protein
MEETGVKGYRVEVTLPREFSVKLEALRKDMQVVTKKRVTKSTVILLIIKKFLERVSE